MEKIKIGIVGCGDISEIHADAVSTLKSCRLVAACTRNPERLDSFCKRYSTLGYTSYDEFLNHPGLDIVSICTPTGTHLDYGKMAAEAGKHVIVEKPIEITVSRGRSLIDSCRQNNVKLAVIYQNRFIDAAVRMKQYKQIIEAISAEGEPVVSGEDSLKSLAVVEALYQSAKTETPVFTDKILSVETVS